MTGCIHLVHPLYHQLISYFIYQAAVTPVRISPKFKILLYLIHIDFLNFILNNVTTQNFSNHKMAGVASKEACKQCKCLQKAVGRVVGVCRCFFTLVKKIVRMFSQVAKLR